MIFKLFDMYEKEVARFVKEGYVLPAYDYVLKCSHTFNLLDAGGAISLSERTESVSYTHLDVYKRQEYSSLMCIYSEEE